MKRIICMLAVLMLCVMLPLSAFAAENEFVPSISYKDGPEIEDAVMNEEDVAPCLVVSSIREAEEKSTDISQEARDLLLEVYEQLLKDQMKLPVDDGYIVRELVDVSWLETTCVDGEHGHEEWLEEANTQLEVVFDLGVKPGTDVVVFVYVDDKWVEVETKNNEDGTVTCIFEDICPVAFCIDPDDEVNPPATGDLAMGELMLWGGVMLASAILLVILLARRRKES